MDASTTHKAAGRARIVCLICYAVAMAYVEALVVVYLRRLVPASIWEQARTYADLCALIEQAGIRWSEQTREFATVVMLASVAFLFADAWRRRAAAFLIAFGIWDIFYYVFLFIWLRWPATLMTPDVLFLIPCPWVSPVFLPVLVSCLMVTAGFLMLRERRKPCDS